MEREREKRRIKYEMCLFLMWGADVGGLAASLSESSLLPLFCGPKRCRRLFNFAKRFFPAGLFRKLRAVEAGFFLGGEGNEMAVAGFSPLF